uniref:Beta-defensin n=1 Tax=Acanthochromis polyacanthus TaxID=80966 RepID=A0A3Q1EE23_9TELE
MKLNPDSSTEFRPQEAAHTSYLVRLSVQLTYRSRVENEAASFPWSCPSLSGVCRKVCLPTEMFFGPLGCGKGFLCCVSHFL